MRAFFKLLVLLAVAGAGWWWWTHRPPSAEIQARQRRSTTIPVLATPAVQQDVPVYLDGLGTAQASATVTIKSFVDGPLKEVRFKEGQDVAVGDVLALIDPRLYQALLDQATAKQAQDNANLANARVDAARYAKLASTAYASAQQADTAKAVVAQLEAQVASDQAQIDTARTNLEYTTIKAPIAGRIGLRLMDAGNIVHASDATGLGVITTLKPISVLFTLPQQALAPVAAAMQAGTPDVEALPQTGADVTDRPILDRGKLTVLDNQVDATTGTIKLKASFPNDRLQIWPGSFVTVRLKVDTLRNAVVVPPSSVQRGPKGTYVYVVSPDQTVTRRTVTVAHEDVAQAVIGDGLKAGDLVVTDGASRLTDGAKVIVTQPVTTEVVAPRNGRPAGARPIVVRPPGTP